MDFLLKTEFGKDNSVFLDAYSIRLKVFCEEQGIPIENEIDSLDDLAYHCVIYIEGKPVACGRMLIEDNAAKLCRIAVLKIHRKKGYATCLSRHLISIAQQNELEYVYLHAQTYISELYEKMGFISEGAVFLEEHIPHIKMTKPLL